MASFTESATLKVVDQSTAEIKRINAALKSLMKTTNSLKSVTATIDIKPKGLARTMALVKTLEGSLKNLKAAKINITANTSQAMAAINRVRSQASRPVSMRMGGYGAAGFTTDKVARAVKDGVNASDIGDFSLDALQLTKKERAAAEAAINKMSAEQKTPLMSRGMITQTLAETLPTAKYNVQDAAWLARQQQDLIAMEVARGKSLEQARQHSAKYIKALELGGLLTDKTGAFDQKSAESYLNALKQIAPAIGKDMSGEFVFQFMKYARTARYTMTPEGFQAGLLTAEEMGASSAGTALNQAVRQLTGDKIPKETLANLAKLGLVTTKQSEEVTDRGKRSKKRVVDVPLDENELRQNFWTFARDKLIPKMREQGLDPNNPLDVAKFAGPITSTQTAKDIVIAAINRAQEIKAELERARTRDPSKSGVEGSIRGAAIGLQTQVEGVLGETVSALEPVLLPAMKNIGEWFNTLGVDLRKAAGGDKEAQKRVEETAATGAVGAAALSMTSGMVGKAIAAVAAPMGITAGLAGAMAPGATEASKSLSLAGVSLNAAGAALQTAAMGFGNIIGGPIGALLRKGGATGMLGMGIGGLAMFKDQIKDRTDIQGPLDNARADLDRSEKDVGQIVEKINGMRKEWAKYDDSSKNELINKRFKARDEAYKAELEAALERNKSAVSNVAKLQKVMDEYEKWAEQAAKEPNLPKFWEWLEKAHKDREQGKTEEPKPTITPRERELRSEDVQDDLAKSEAKLAKRYKSYEKAFEQNAAKPNRRNALRLAAAQAELDKERATNQYLKNKLQELEEGPKPSVEPPKPTEPAAEEPQKITEDLSNASSNLQLVINSLPQKGSEAGSSFNTGVNAQAIGSAIGAAFVAMASGVKVGVDVSGITQAVNKSNTGTQTPVAA